MLTDVVITNKSYTKMLVPEEQEMDMIALKVIRQDCPDFLMPVRIMEIDGETEIRFELVDGIRLSYMPKEMKKRDFIELFVNMLTPFSTCSDWFLDYHNFLLDENYILIGKNQRSVRYIYLPVAEYRNTEEAAKNFFVELMLKIDIVDDAGYMVNLLRVIKDPDAGLLSLLEYFKKERNVPQERVEKKPENRSVVFQSEPRNQIQEQPPKPEKEIKEFGKSDEEGRLMGALFGETEPEVEKKKKKDKKEKKEKNQKNGGFLGLFKGKGEKEAKAEPDKLLKANQELVSQPMQERAWEPLYDAWQNSASVPTEMEEEVTSVEGMVSADGSVLQLCRELCTGCNCPEVIEIDMKKGYATIGRANKNGEMQSDFNFDASVSFVSRRHFRVERSDCGWVLIDLGSSNGTYINGEKLIPNIAYHLSSGDRIMICCNKRQFVYRVC